MSKSDLVNATVQVAGAMSRLNDAQELLKQEGVPASYRIQIALEQLVEAEQYINDLIQKREDNENGTAKPE